MAVATANWNSAMNGTGVCRGARGERGGGAKRVPRRGAAQGPEEQKPRARERRPVLSRAADRALLSAACVREVAGSTAGETLTPERTVLLDAEAAAKIFLAIALFFRLLSC